MTHIETMKLALEALEENHHLIEEHERPDYLALYDRRIHSLRQAIAEAEKEGWKLVPVEPTDAMLDSAQGAVDDAFRIDIVRMYSAMLASAPHGSDK